MAKKTETKQPAKPETEQTSEPKLAEKLALSYARRRWAWMKAHDLLLVRAHLRSGTLAEHLLEKGAHAATEYQRLLVNGEQPPDADAIAGEMIAPSRPDIDPLDEHAAAEVRRHIAEFDRSSEGRQFAEPRR